MQQQYQFSQLNPSYQPQNFTQQVRQFFRDYLQDISRIILKIKQNIYKLVNLQALKINHKVQIKPQLASMYVHCKKTFDDLKRIDMLVEGLVKAKDIDLKSSSITYKRRKRNQNQQDQLKARSRLIQTDQSEGFLHSPLKNDNFIDYSRINSATSPEIFKISRAKSIQNTYVNQIKSREYMSPKYSQINNKRQDNLNLDPLKIIQDIKNQLFKF